ncbi:MAG TPA: L-threonylcarbamoyladenylate synthase [Candidatus Brocadiia bacterium]|nr:L-threonylcarbamoyladenylate synthase [Candidatus Brocadiia bacterium]
MPPRVLKWESGATNDRLLAQVAEALASGGLAAFPTDTVYGVAGLFGLAGTEDRLLAAKGYGEKRPFQVLVDGMATLERLAPEMPPVAKALAGRFWPGPLTIVTPLAGGGVIGLRWPAHELACAVIRAAGGALMASSANRAGGAPARCAAEAVAALGDHLAVAIDGGDAGLGAASSVVRVTSVGWEILREEAVTRQALELAAGSPPMGEKR